MVVDSAYISAMSNGLFTVSATGGTITPETFNLYLSQATSQVNEEAPYGVSSALKDELVAMQVCHRIIRADNRLEFNSESIDGVSYNKEAGESTWSIAYEKLLKSTSRKIKNVGLLKATHTDSTSNLKFDDAAIVS